MSNDIKEIDYDDLSLLFKMFSDPTRLKILNELINEEYYYYYYYFYYFTLIRRRLS